MATRRRIWRIRVLAKSSPFLASASTRQHGRFQKYARLAKLATLAEPFCEYSPDSPTFAKPCCADSPDSPTFAKPCCADSPDLQKASLASVTQIWRVWRIWRV